LHQCSCRRVSAHVGGQNLLTSSGIYQDRNGSEPAQYAWSSVRERGVYRKKPQPRTWEFYMKLGTTLRTIESSQGCWNERRAGCATMKPLVCCHRPLAARAATASTHSSILLHSKLLNVGIYSLRYLDQFLSQRILAICVNTHVSRCPADLTHLALLTYR